MIQFLHNRTRSIFLLFLLSFSTLFSFSQTFTPRYISTSANSGGFYEYLPQGYGTGSGTYPVLIFLHGIGEEGNGSAAQLPNILHTGLPALIKNGGFPASFVVNGQTFKYIVICPQFIKWPSLTDVDAVVNYTLSHYQVNPSRLYITGLSMGGGPTWEYTATSPYINKVAGIVPICGASYPAVGRANALADANIAVWATVNSGDPSGVAAYTEDYVSEILARNPKAPAKVSVFPSTSHDAWTHTYDPNFTENGLNIYQWLLQYQKGTPPPPVNQLPIVNAGTDASITLPTSSYQIKATASDPDGTIAKYAWTKTAGPTAFTISNATILNPVMSGLTAGIYTFRLTVTDNSGGTAYNDINITVNSAPVNKIPVVNAGTDATVTLPTSSYQIAATASDPDGTIAKYAWTKTAGPTAFTISNAAILSPLISGLVAGTYTFRLTVTDNSGATAFDDINITVNSASSGTTVKTLNVNIYGGANPYQDTHWNNWNVVTAVIPSVNIASGKFAYDDGSASTISATLSLSQTVADNGTTYGGGMAPSQVLRYVSYSSTDRTLTLSGLTIGKTYDISLYSSRANPNNPTKFTVGSLSTTIATYDNLTNKVTFTSLQPNSSGQIVVTILRTASFSYINGFTITENSGTASTSQPEVLSDITEVTAETTESAALTIYPNPVMDQFTVRLNNPIIGEMDIRLLSMSGQLIERYHAVKDQDVFSQTCYLKNIPKGTYVVDVKIGHLWSRAKVITKL